jgi:hypothetical protein
MSGPFGVGAKLVRYMGSLARRRLVGLGRVQELSDGGGEPARVGDRKAVPEAGQPRPQPGQATSRAPVLLGVPRQRRRREHQPGRSGRRPKLASTSPQRSTRSCWRQNASAPGECPGTSSTSNPPTRSPSRRMRVTGWAVTGARVRWRRLTSGEPWVSTRPLVIAAASPAPHHSGRSKVWHSQAEQPAWSKWAWVSRCALSRRPASWRARRRRLQRAPASTTMSPSR